MAGLYAYLSQRPLLLITSTFLLWKAILFTAGLTSPGVGYDTSTSLLEGSNGDSSLRLPKNFPWLWKMVRWDAIYFVQLSERGHLFEQEWAWGIGHSTLVGKLNGVFFGDDGDRKLEHYVMTGLMLSFVSHLLSTLLLWRIAIQICGGSVNQSRAVATVPTVAAILHIVSPAGVFLAAPYAESSFSSLNFMGFWLYLKGRSFEVRKRSLQEMLFTIGAGIAFGFATITRSNGLLSGLPLLQDALLLCYALLFSNSKHSSKLSLLVALASTIIAGCFTAIGMALPQLIAYREYCVVEASQRPWCQRALPLIFEFVQSHYWNVGFLRYWTVSNIPLFLLATPCLVLMFQSGIFPFSAGAKSSVALLSIPATQRLALPQLTLALLAVTNYHVQIITRLSSGYPWWYIWLAAEIRTSKQSEVAVRYFVLYALIQAALFTSFLPPA